MTVQMAPRGSGRSARWNRLSLIFMGAGVSALVAATVLFVLGLTGTVGDSGYSGPGTSTVFGSPVERYFTPQPTPTVPPPPPSEAPVARIVIPRFEVDAPVVVRGVDANGVMETPDGPWDVAWYDIRSDDSDRPGFGSNAIFSGHVDYINVGPAVFWNLKDLEQGDLVEVRLDDGTVYRYSVSSREQVGAAPSEEEIRKIVGQTEQEIITLITCGGTFDASVGQYDQRVVVRAERVFDDALGPGAGAAASP